MNNEKQIQNDENLNGTITRKVDIFNRKPLPVMEYGKPLLFCIENVYESEKEIIVKGKDEHTPDTARLVTWYTITGHLISTDYGTTGKPFSFNVFTEMMDAITMIAHEQNTLIFSAVFEPVRFEYDVKDENGNPTGEHAVKIRPELLTASPLSIDEVRKIKKLIK